MKIVSVILLWLIVGFWTAVYQIKEYPIRFCSSELVDIQDKLVRQDYCVLKDNFTVMPESIIATIFWPGYWFLESIYYMSGKKEELKEYYSEKHQKYL